eukprot:6363831-Amphidinium_carterae.2
MREYLVKAASTLEKRSIIEQQLHSLQHDMQDSDPSKIVLLVQMLEQVPGFMLAVREGALNDYLSHLKAKVISMRVLLEEHMRPKLTTQALKDLDVLFSQATVVWPLDAAYQADLHSVAELSHKVSCSERLMSLTDACVALKGIDYDKRPEFTTLLEKIVHMLSESNHMAHLDDAANAKIKAAVLCTFEFMKHWWSELDTQLDDMQQCAAAAKRMATVINNAALQSLAVGLETAVVVGKLYSKVNGEEGEKTTAEVSKHVASLERKLQSMNFPTVDPAVAGLDLKDHPLFQRLQGFKATATNVCKQTKDQCSKDAKTALEKSCTHLKETCSTGQDWLAGFAGENFQAFLTHAESTLLKQSAEAMVKAIDAVKEAV